MLLTLSGWTSPRIAEAFGVQEDTVRLWRSDFMRGGVDALKASVAPGPDPVKSETALRVVTPLLEAPVANRPNWTIARLRAEIEKSESIRISRSQLSEALRKKIPLVAPSAHVEGTPDRKRGGSDRFASAFARAPGRIRRYRAALRPDARQGVQAGRVGGEQSSDPYEQGISGVPCRPRVLAHGLMPTKIFARAHRHRGRLARPQGVSPCASDVH